MSAAGQKVERDEMASYRTLRAFANRLGRTEAASILEETLEEEKQAAKRLTTIPGAQAFFLHGSSVMSLRASILVADDDQTSARFLKRLLTKEGHHVAVVQTGAEALDACRAAPPDLVFVDLVAARGEGFDVCRRLKHETATRFIPVVIITAQGDRTDRLKGIEAGCDDFLAKPFDSTELHARIRSLVRLKRFTDELESAEAIILGLGATIEARDPNTQGHCQRLARFATTLGRELGLDATDVAAIASGGYLHELG